jgi:NDP-sugar pyrophosphorylase family protein
MIVHQIEALVAAGVKDIVLAVNYRPEVMEKFLQEVCCGTNWRLNTGIAATAPGINQFSSKLTRSALSMRKSTTSTSSSPSNPNPSILPVH